MNTTAKIKNLALCAVFSSLNIAFLFFGTMLDILDLTVASLCSVITIIVLSETSTKYSLLMYFASSVLALLFLPTSTASIFYVSFFGYFPIITMYINKLGKVLSTIVSFTAFNAVMVVDFLIFTKITGISGEKPWMYVVLLILANIFFLAYRYIIAVFKIIYIKKLKKVFKLK